MARRRTAPPGCRAMPSRWWRASRSVALWSTGWRVSTCGSSAASTKRSTARPPPEGRSALLGSLVSMSETNTLTEPVITVTEHALAKILELRAGEDTPDELGLRIEVTGVRGAEFSYDLAFEPLAECATDDVRDDH